MSEHEISLRNEARALPMEERRRILMNMPETEMHGYLASLFRAMNPSYWVEVTHGGRELGKDLVVVRDDPLSPDVIAIVVKRGNVRAKTAGDVDVIKEAAGQILSARGNRITAEIRSQVRQAHAHPAELKGIFTRLQVTKVIVILVGEISAGVRTRFEGEVGAAALVYDLRWLVSSFTEHYPQVFFDARVVDFLQGMIGQLERDSFYAKTNRSLSQCFVDPIIQPDRRVSLDRDSLKVEVKEQRVHFGSLLSFVKRKRRVILVGDAGSGKSKAVAKLCIDSYREVLAQSGRNGDREGSEPLPLLITARDLEQIESPDALVDKVLPLAVREQFGLGLLIVDGLDEVAAGHREMVLDRAAKFSEQLDAVLLITARNTAAFATAPSGFSRCVLLPFQVSQALKLVEKVLTSIDVLPALRTGIQRIQAQLPMSPLSLLLLIDVVSERKEVPSSITELYDRFLDLVFGRWDRDKGVDVLFEYIVKKRFLAALAFHRFFSVGRLEIPLPEFNAFVKEYATEYGWDDAKLLGFIKEIERAGILVIQEECFFRHRSFLDYFVAFYLYEHRDAVDNLTNTVVAIYYDQLWSDVAFFFTGLSRDVSPEILDGIFDFGDDRPIEKLLAGRLLQAGWHSPTRVKEKGIRRALSFAPATADLVSKIGAARIADSGNGSRVLGDMCAVVLSEYSLGSMFLSQELDQFATEMEAEGLADRDAALKRLAVLRALRNIAEPSVLTNRLKRFIVDVQRANLPTKHETEMLVLAGATDQESDEIRKAITRRLRRILKSDPGIVRTVLPNVRLPYRPPRAK